MIFFLLGWLVLLVALNLMRHLAAVRPEEVGRNDAMPLPSRVERQVQGMAIDAVEPQDVGSWSRSIAY